MKNTKTKNNVFILSILFLGVLLCLFVVTYSLNNNKYQAVEPTKNNLSTTYRSKFLKISFNIPYGYQIEDKQNSINISGHKGSLNIGSIGTNFINLNDYLENLAKLNHLNFVNKKYIKINNLDGVKTDLYAKQNDKYLETAYFIFSKNWVVYSLGTNSKNLLDDLDKIALSVIYTP